MIPGTSLETLQESQHHFTPLKGRGHEDSYRVAKGLFMLTGKSQWQGLVPAGHATSVVKRQRETSVLMLPDCWLSASFLQSYTVQG